MQRAAGSWGGWPGCGCAVTVSGMPFKHNAARRHRIPKLRYRVQNWPAYAAGLKRRGDLTLWLDEAALARWQAPRRTTPGGQARYSQARYSDAAIELVLDGYGLSSTLPCARPKASPRAYFGCSGRSYVSLTTPH